VATNNAWIAALRPAGAPDWDVQGLEGLDPRGWYLCRSNHQSWVDILVLQRVFHGRIPFLKFFLKQELIWVPVIGLAWWALDFPFMKRGKGSGARSADLATTRAACEKFKRIPTSVINFVEGTRFTPAKHAQQQSPYRHLLKPKIGGLGMALATMGEQFGALLDVTIVYPQGTPTFWDLLCGRVQQVVVRVQQRPIPPELLGCDPMTNKPYRQRLGAWVDGQWQEKDVLLQQWLGPCGRRALTCAPHEAATPPGPRCCASTCAGCCAAARPSQVRYWRHVVAADRARAEALPRQPVGRAAGGVRRLGKPQQQAFLINAYNAFTVELILTRWPDLKSIKDLGSLLSSPWKPKWIRCWAARCRWTTSSTPCCASADDYDEPRVHFAVNCASIGCPMLREEAFVADRLDAQLESRRSASWPTARATAGTRSAGGWSCRRSSTGTARTSRWDTRASARWRSLPASTPSCWPMRRPTANGCAPAACRWAFWTTTGR
jgi:hypothetical protein